MVAAAKLCDFTQAEGVDVRVPARPRDSYAAATAPETSRLLFPGPRMQVQTVIQAGGREYSLRGMFVIEFEMAEDDLVFARHRTLPVDGHGSTQLEAVGSFCETFDFQWRNLVEVDERELTESARQRRQAMRDVVANVREVGAPR